MDSSGTQICDTLLPLAFDRNFYQQQVYRYQHLEGKDQIRLLQITDWSPYWAAKPVDGSSARSPQYDIIHVGLQDAPTYQPVSYVWGHPEKTHCIRLGANRILPLTESLASALPSLIRACHAGYLWIDQICINQANTQEKSQQVGLMARIYADMDCLIWAGNHIPNLNVAVDLNSLGHRNCDETTNQPCLELLGRPWFTRAWVVQEAALASSNTVLVGQHRIPLMKFCRALTNIWTGNAWDDEQAKLLIDSERAASLSSILQIKASRIPASQASIGPGLRRCHSFLNQLANCETSEPRDRAYAFLAVLPDSYVNSFIKPDYTLSVAEVFTKLARSIVYSSNHLDLFELLPQFDNGRCKILNSIDSVWYEIEELKFNMEISVDKMPFQRSIDGVQLPSWVPNWTLRKLKPIGSTMDFVGKSSHSHANWQSPWNELEVMGVTETRVKHKIFTAGEWVDDIRHMRDKFLCQTRSLDLWPSLSDFLSRINLKDDALSEVSDCDCDLNLKRNVLFLDFMARLSDFKPPWGEKIGQLDDEHTWRLASASMLEGFLCRLPGDHDLVYCEDGQVALTPSCCAEGDIIALIRGSKVPVVLRQQVYGRYTVLGQCLLEGTGTRDGNSPLHESRCGYWDARLKREDELFILT